MQQNPVATAILTAFVSLLPERSPDWVIFAVVAHFGAVVIPTYGIVIAHVNDFVPSGDFVSASGGLLIVQGIGAATGPVLAGAAMSWASPAGLAYTTILAQVLMAVWGMYRMTMRSSPSPEAKEHFVPMPTVTVGTSLAPAPEHG